MKLKKMLKKQGYSRNRIVLLNSMHLCIAGKINGKKGKFLLDTGASNSCLDKQKAKKFRLKSKKSKVLAVGAGKSDIQTEISAKNNIQIGTTSFNKFPLILLDLSHVNIALEQMDSTKVHGVIGADILKEGKAIIDYDKFWLYLKN